MGIRALKRLIVICLLAVSCASCHTAGDKPGVTSSIYSIADYGAAGDGKTLCTEAIQKAIDMACESGGGKVVIAPGHWLSGTIVLKSGVTLHLEKEGVLLGSTDVADYPEKISAVRSYRRL